MGTGPVQQVAVEGGGRGAAVLLHLPEAVAERVVVGGEGAQDEVRAAALGLDLYITW